MIKRLSKILILLLIISIITGCDNTKKIKSSTGNKIKKESDITKREGTLLCTRSGTVEGGEGEFNYIINYKEGNILSIHSEESIKSTDSEVLNTFETAYNKIDSYYTGIKYYDTSINKTEDNVTHIIDIDYEKIDINQLIDLEGEEDNIFENNQPKVDKYLDLAKKMGVTCNEKE